MKGAMYSSFRRASLYIACYQKRVCKNAMFRQIVPGTEKKYQEDFSKVVVLNRSAKEAISSSFCRVPCTQHFLSVKIQQKFNTQTFCQCQYLDNYQGDFPKVVVLKQSVIKKHCAGSLIDHPVHNLPSAKIQQKYNVEAIVSRTGKIYQKDLPKIAVSKCSTKGAAHGYFRKVPCTQLTNSKESAKMQCLGKMF